MEAAPAKVGSDQHAYVRAEITLEMSSLADKFQREWDSLRPDDVIYLLAIRPNDDRTVVDNVDSTLPSAKLVGLLYLRSAEVVQLLDENGRIIRDPSLQQVNGNTRRTRTRRLLVNIDAHAYKCDEEQKAKGKEDVYDTLNIIVRRKGRANNFKRILESIKALALSDIPLPIWLQEVFLGYGDPAGATFSRLSNRLQSIDFRDTFLDWQHLIESLPGKVCAIHFTILSLVPI